MSPGEHGLELTSVLGGVESQRSPRLLVIVAGSATTTGMSFEQPAPASHPAFCSTPQADCYAAQLLATRLGAVTALTPIPDGRVMFIEAGRQVRIISREEPGSAIALSTEDGRELTGLTIDPEFATTRAVFVAWTEPAQETPGLNITRYRELGNVLGEGATIVSGLPTEADSTTPCAFDNDGLFYIALPVDRRQSAPRFLGGTGTVLRFDRDGRVPSSNQHGSPIVAEGYPSPLALAFEPSNGRVWLTGRGYQQLGDIAAFGIVSVDHSAWPTRPAAVRAPPTRDEPIESITFLTGTTGDGDTQLIISAGGKLQRLVVTPDGGVSKISDIPLGEGYSILTVAADQGNSLYVSASTGDGFVSLFKLTKLSS
jgi:hypothetical protein